MRHAYAGRAVVKCPILRVRRAVAAPEVFLTLEVAFSDYAFELAVVLMQKNCLNTDDLRVADWEVGDICLTW